MCRHTVGADCLAPRMQRPPGGMDLYRPMQKARGDMHRMLASYFVTSTTLDRVGVCVMYVWPQVKPSEAGR